jgi:hypothetical protein
VFLAGLKLLSCLRLLNAKITGTYHNSQLWRDNFKILNPTRIMEIHVGTVRYLFLIKMEKTKMIVNLH